jgi:hypothetical protein
MKKTLLITLLLILSTGCIATQSEQANQASSLYPDQEEISDTQEPCEPCEPVTYFPDPEVDYRNYYYEYEDAVWKLLSGFPPYADPHPLHYEGEAILEGWIIYTDYHGPDIEIFTISVTDLKKLPPPLHDNKWFYLRRYSEDQDEYYDLDEETRSQLIEQYSKENPAKVLVDRIKIYMDGTVQMNFKGILN